MKTTGIKIFEAVGRLPDEYVTESDSLRVRADRPEKEKRSRRPAWLTDGVIAAAVCVLVGIVTYVGILTFMSGGFDHFAAGWFGKDDTTAETSLDGEETTTQESDDTSFAYNETTTEKKEQTRLVYPVESQLRCEIVIFYEYESANGVEVLAKLNSYALSNNTKLNNTKIVEKISGCSYELPYQNTIYFEMQGCEKNYYAWTDGANAVGVFIDDKTGKIVEYSTLGNIYGENKPEYPVNKNSTEEEFISYAKNILLEHADFNSDGWEVEVSTETFDRDSDSMKTESGFVNNSQNDPNFYAEYTITFYKTYNFLRRCDDVKVVVKNTGEIIKFHVFEYDERFKRFENVLFDPDQVIEAFPSGKNYELLSLVLVPYEKELWALATFDITETIDGQILNYPRKVIAKVGEIK